MRRSRIRLRAAERPFPWVCPTCLGPNVRPIVKAYTAKVRHDGVDYSLNIPSLEIPTCGSCGEEVFSDNVDQQVNSALRAHLVLLTPQQLRAARKALGLRQTELGRRLKIAPATICRWESGAQIQSRAMDNYMRLFFGIPAVREALAGDRQDPLRAIGVQSAKGGGASTTADSRGAGRPPTDC